MLVAEFDASGRFSAVFDGDGLFVFFADFEEAEVDEGFEQDLAFHFIDSDG